ncbi:VTC domain protein [Anatilimnocola aggregata]|uniref:VTC domain protein n=1 Tax=Anatilimnocola aggregata TaxID=2528021 RepID=A0A517YB78_9BACT|nr:polyphosphate polymerase domain-containing protein [Anatilimnocola aggregata]QDU27382.1 VTC domain protein [Anatilimnocola aggregata]
MHASAEPERSQPEFGPRMTGSKEAGAALSSTVSGSSNTTPPNRSRSDHRFGQYELKFLLSEGQAAQVIDWARIHMARDPVALCDESEMYQVHSVYLDTPALGVFGRAGALRTRKYRLRRYGHEETIWLERKAKVRGRVKKRRTAIQENQLACLHQQAPPPHWPGHWFRRRVQLRQLQPVCSVTYERFARVGLTPEGPIRMTLDRAIGGSGLLESGVDSQPAANWEVPRSSLSGLNRLSGLCILELKYPTTLPALFKGVMSDFTLDPLKVSKFRTCMETWVVPPAEEIAGDVSGSDESRAVA